MREIIEALLASLGNLMITYGLKLLGAIVVLVVGLKLIKLFPKCFENTKGYKRMDPTIQSFTNSATKLALKVILFVTVAAIMGIPMTSFVTVLGTFGVALGLALQGGLSNVASGIMILIFNPFSVGEFIDNHQDSGEVTEITLFHTVLTTLDKKRVIIPNSKLTSETVVNMSREPIRRVDMVFGTSYDDDMSKTVQVLTRVVTQHPKVHQDPAPFIRMGEMAADSLNYTVRVWCNAEDYWDVKFDITESVKKAFDDNNISIPYGQLDVHIKQ